ncbi:MAG: NAD-dependent epimerase/dehydratase family protein [Mycetocola sp.]
MKLLVTGGAGFIGSTIVDAALDRGWDVRVLDSMRSDVHGDTPVIDQRVDLLRGDVRDADAVARALDGVDAVCHQAAKVGLGVDFSDAPDYVSSNDVGTAVLLAGMAAAGIRRLVQASSMVVYGEGQYRGPSGLTRPAPRLVADLDAGRFDPRTDDGDPLTPELIGEDSPLDPRNVYATTKLSQEYLASSWARSSGGVVASLRYHNVYGPGMPQNTPYAGVASLFRSALERGEAPRVFEDGGQRRDFVHVRDVASANLAAIEWTGEQNDGTSRAFNVGSGDVHTIGDLAESVSRHAGGPAPIVTGEYRLGDVRHITASSERLRTELGWSPAVMFDDGMREFATATLRAAVDRAR